MGYCCEIFGREENEWGDPFIPQSLLTNSKSSKPSEPISRSINVKTPYDKEGTMGTPGSFIDIDDAKIIKKQREYEKNCKLSFKNNKSLVTSLIQQGVVMPTEGMVKRIVENLRKIASGRQG